MHNRTRTTRSRLAAVTAVAGGLALILAGCGGAEVPSANGWEEPSYDSLPADLTADEVCALLDDETISTHLGVDVSGSNPGSYQSDCQWYYKLEDGPATNLQVQVMTMSQTSERLGTEALEWGLSGVPSDKEILRFESLSMPNAGYEFGHATMILAVDPSGRLVTVSADSQSPEEGRLAIVEAVIAALAANHS